MMKRFSTRANKWLYVFALISHIFNFFAKSQILFLYYIDDHQENHLFFLLILFYSIFKLFSYSFCSLSSYFFSLLLSVFLFFFLLLSVFVDRLSLVPRRLFVICLIFERSKSSSSSFSFSFCSSFSFFFSSFFFSSFDVSRY